MTLRLDEDHENARELARLLGKIPGVSLDESTVEINMVFFKAGYRGDAGFFADRITAAMRERGILINPPFDGEFRFVTHYWIDAERVRAAATAFAEAYARIGSS